MMGQYKDPDSTPGSLLLLTQKHIDTLKNRLDKAVTLIDDDRYLPMFRNRQIHYGELFDFSQQLAKNKKNPSHYFAHIWSRKNLKKTLEWLAKLHAKAQSKAAEVRENMKNRRRQSQKVNHDNLKRLAQLKKSYNLLS